jgi:hypothetical protein
MVLTIFFFRWNMFAAMFVATTSSTEAFKLWPLAAFYSCRRFRTSCMGTQATIRFHQSSFPEGLAAQADTEQHAPADGPCVCAGS